MRAIQNADGHVGLTAREYPIAAATTLIKGQVVKLSGGKVVSAAAAETGAILGIAAESHSGSSDMLNPRSNADTVLVYDNPGLIMECPAPSLLASSGSATTVAPRSGDIDADAADDTYNNAVLLLKSKAAGSANTDPVGCRVTVSDYTKTGTVLTKSSGGTPTAGDCYEMYPALGSSVCALNDNKTALVVTDGGATKLKVVGHDYERHMLRVMAVEHALGTEN